jgi:hypothetical protein
MERRQFLTGCLCGLWLLLAAWPAQAQDGQWVLVDTKTQDLAGNENSIRYTGRASNGSAETSFEGTTSKGEPYTMFYQYSWTPPPTHLVPGQEVKLEYTGRPRYEGPPDSGPHRWTTLRLDWVDINSPYDTGGQLDPPLEPGRPPVTYPISFQVPAGSLGSQKSLRVTALACAAIFSGRWVHFEYIYEYQAGNSGLPGQGVSTDEFRRAGMPGSENPEGGLIAPPRLQLGPLQGPATWTQWLGGTTGPLLLGLLLQGLLGGAPGGGSPPPPSPEPPEQPDPDEEQRKGNLSSLLSEKEYREQKIKEARARLGKAKTPSEKSQLQQELREHEHVLTKTNDEIRYAQTGEFQKTQTELEKLDQAREAEKRKQFSDKVKAKEEKRRADLKERLEMRKAIDKLPPDRAFQIHTIADSILSKGGPNEKQELARKITKIAIKEDIADAEKRSAEADEKAAIAQFGLDVANNLKTGTDLFVMGAGFVPGAGQMVSLGYNSTTAGIDGYHYGGLGQAGLEVFNSLNPYDTYLQLGLAVKDGNLKDLTYNLMLGHLQGKLMGKAVSKLGLGNTGIKNSKPTKEPKPKKQPPEHPVVKELKKKSKKSPPNQSKFVGLDHQQKSAQAAAKKQVADFDQLHREHVKAKYEKHKAVLNLEEARDKVTGLTEQIKRAKSQGKSTNQLEKQLGKANQETSKLYDDYDQKRRDTNKAFEEKRQKAMELNGNYQAKNLMKYQEKRTGKAFDEALQSNYQSISTKFEQEMLKKGWTKQQIKDFRNKSSAGSVGMDRDVGLVEPSALDKAPGGAPKYSGADDPQLLKDKHTFSQQLKQNGQKKTVHAYNKEAQQTYDEIYDDHYGQSTGKPGRGQAHKAQQEFTTSANPEAYRDIKVLEGHPENGPFRPDQKWADQTADVTAYKGNVLQGPNSPLNTVDSYQELARGSGKDLSTKVIPILEGSAGHIDQKKLNNLKALNQVLKSVGEGDEALSWGNQKINNLFPGKGLDDVHNIVSEHLRIALKFS